jgi:hypothetical protein
MEFPSNRPESVIENHYTKSAICFILDIFLHFSCSRSQITDSDNGRSMMHILKTIGLFTGISWRKRESCHSQSPLNKFFLLVCLNQIP